MKTKEKIESIDEELKKRFDDLEGIIGNEPQKNKYETVKFHKLNIFPYFLIGKIQSKFEIDGNDRFLNGVGMLIGPEILLTVAHNIVIMNDTQIYEAKKIYFYPAANGDFTTFDNVKSIRNYVNNEYIEALKSNDYKAQIHSDWGLIYLSSKVGLEISTLFGINETYASKLAVNQDGLYSYFTFNETQDIKKFQNLSQKISMVGYTECKTQYKDNNMYRFGKNFVSKSEKLTQKSQIQFAVEDKEQKDQNINININITKDANIATEGLVSNSRFNEQKKLDKTFSNTNLNVNGTDYIVFGHESFNKDFDHSETEKLVMSESKGNLIEEDGDSIIKYKISTYKGQSGSPIFLRVKKLTNINSPIGAEQPEQKHEYIYHFIGLHSRRGPTNEEQTDPKEGCIEPDSELNDQVNEGKIELKSSTNIVNSRNELVRIHGLCAYNIALSILGRSTKKIINAIKDLNSSLEKKNFNNLPLQTNTKFILVKLLMNDEEKLTGLFKKTTSMELIFSLGAKVLNISKEYILIKDLQYTDTEETIHNYGYDNTKVIGDLSVSNGTAMYEVMVNFKKYGELLANKIFQKFLENYDLEIDQLKKDFIRKYSKKLFQAIFSEINNFENVYPTYGKLFKKIRDEILKKVID